MDPALGMEKGAPTSNRICQDTRKFIHALTGIRDARGIYVQGLGFRAGHRAAAANGQVQRGGKREKKVATEDPWFHSYRAETRLRLIAASRERHAKKFNFSCLFEMVPGCFGTRPFACALFAA
jgi:hypothetical protein